MIKCRVWNIPEEGYVISRLKPPEFTTEAIGFTANFNYDEEESD